MAANNTLCLFYDELPDLIAERSKRGVVGVSEVQHRSDGSKKLRALR
jgi:hypothetical protein